jgi:hypothetical protein
MAFLNVCESKTLSRKYHGHMQIPALEVRLHFPSTYPTNSFTLLTAGRQQYSSFRFLCQTAGNNKEQRTIQRDPAYFAENPFKANQ